MVCKNSTVGIFLPLTVREARAVSITRRQSPARRWPPQSPRRGVMNITAPHLRFTLLVFPSWATNSYLFSPVFAFRPCQAWVNSRFFTRLVWVTALELALSKAKFIVRLRMFETVPELMLSRSFEAACLYDV